MAKPRTTGKSIPPSLPSHPENLRVVCIGAGLSGLTIAYKLKHEKPLAFLDLTIYEKNPEVGGTWFENIYPGVACDVPVLISSRLDEEEEEFDLIVCATGFNYSFIPPWELIGRDDRRLDEEWKDTPEAYFATCAAGVPNCFIFGGPDYPVGHGPLPAAICFPAGYMLDWIKKIATEDIKSVVVKDSVVHAYNKFAQETLKRCVWSKGCHAWYSKRNEGADSTVTAMYPGSVLHFKACMEKLRPEHFEIQYNTSNPFRFMGNGQLAFDRKPGADLAFYLK